MWSLDDYCKTELLRQRDEDWSLLPPSSQEFLRSLQLPTIHPFCEATRLDDFAVNGIPPMGPLLQEDYHHTTVDVLVTHLYRVLPALVAMGELWLRLLASILCPLGIAYLVYLEIAVVARASTKDQPAATNMFCAGIVLTVASSIVLMTDTLYVLAFGTGYGVLVFVISSLLALRAASLYQLTWTLQGLLLLKLVTFVLINDFTGTATRTISFGDPVEAVRKVTPGLYYHPHNDFIQYIVHAWPVEKRTYSVELGATPWMPTGDSRTGLPFLMNKGIPRPAFRRLWLETHDQEYVALDISMPVQGHDVRGEKPLYLVLHGLNGGSQEEYVKDFTTRRNAEGATVIVMVARGLMDLPIKGWNIFHGARVDDVHTTALALRKVTGPQQTLAGVGNSMGAIILSNYVARSGSDCALDAAIAISGGLDLRFEHNFYRAQRLWQPMLAKELRDTFLVNKWGERVRARLSLEDLKQTMRASHVTEIDEHAVTPYNRFDNVTHYYMEMSALGDIPLDAYTKDSTLPEYARIHNVAIPFCVVHALDDPLVTWRTVGANKGLMHPATLTSQIRTGNLLVLLTKAGGHVGWPLGWLPVIRKWEWMNDAASTFAETVQKVSQQHTNNRECPYTGGTCDKADADESATTSDSEATARTMMHDADSSSDSGESDGLAAESGDPEAPNVEETSGGSEAGNDEHIPEDKDEPSPSAVVEEAEIQEEETPADTERAQEATVDMGRDEL